jgi:hypothetical protein
MTSFRYYNENIDVKQHCYYILHNARTLRAIRGGETERGRPHREFLTVRADNYNTTDNFAM